MGFCPIEWGIIVANEGVIYFNSYYHWSRDESWSWDRGRLVLPSTTYSFLFLSLNDFYATSFFIHSIKGTWQITYYYYLQATLHTLQERYPGNNNYDYPVAIT